MWDGTCHQFDVCTDGLDTSPAVSFVPVPAHDEFERCALVQMFAAKAGTVCTAEPVD